MLAELKRLAHAGRLFFVDGEEAVRFTAELLVDQPLPAAVAALYEPVGGTHLLELPSGELHLSGVTAWGRGDSGLALRVAPGPHALFVHSREHFNPAAFKAWELATVGAADVAYRDRITWLGAAGCLPTVAAVLAVALPPLRRFALVPVAAAAITWLSYGLLMSLPRSRTIARRARELEAALPLLYLQLRPLASSEGLSGGFVRLG